MTNLNPLVINLIKKKATQFIKNFLDGKLVLVKKAFSENFVNEIKIKVKKYWIENPEAFHEMREGCLIFIESLRRKKQKIIQ